MEAYRDTNWWYVYYFLPREGHTFAKEYRDRNGRCIAKLFKSIGVRGRRDYPDRISKPNRTLSMSSHDLGIARSEYDSDRSGDLGERDEWETISILRVQRLTE